MHAELIRRLSDRYRFTVIANELAHDLTELVTWKRIRLPPRGAIARELLFYIQAGMAVREARPALIHTCGAIVPNRIDLCTLHFSNLAFARQNGLFSRSAPFLRRINTGMYRLLAIAMERWAYRAGRTHMLMAVSAAARLQAEECFPSVRTVAAPNGVDSDRFRPDEETRHSVRAERRVPTGAPVVLFVGGDWDRKGLNVAITAFALVRDVFPEAQLWVAGRGDQSRFTGMARERGVDDTVSFLGHVDAVERILQAADVYLGCSSYETFSLAMLEAAASGLPIVTTDVGVARQIVDDSDGDGEAGYIVPRDSRSIAKAVVALLCDKDRAKMGSVARRRSLAFSWTSLAAQVASAYDALIADDARVTR